MQELCVEMHFLAPIKTSTCWEVSAAAGKKNPNCNIVRSPLTQHVKMMFQQSYDKMNNDKVVSDNASMNQGSSLCCTVLCGNVLYCSVMYCCVLYCSVKVCQNK